MDENEKCKAENFCFCFDGSGFDFGKYDRGKCGTDGKRPVIGIEAALKAGYRDEVMNKMKLYLAENKEGEFLNMAFSNADG